jgi:integrase/recombinase XerC
MPHHAKPFFRTSRGWYVQIGKQQLKLADGPKNADTEAAAWERYHAVMAERPKPPNGQAAPANGEADGLTVAEVFDKYLDWVKKNRAPRTAEWYQEHIQDFINFKPEVARLPVKELKPFHVVEWADSHGDRWSNAYRRGAIVAIQRPMNWAEELGYIDATPIKRIPKPQPQRRESLVTPDAWEKIKSHYAEGDPFRDILEFAWETGCRPQEAKRIEPRHVQLDQHRVVFPVEESKGKKYSRVIFMTPRAEEILCRRMAGIERGVVFRNEDGAPWTAQAMACRFARLKKHLGVKFAAYDFRHGFAQDMLEKGNDATTVGALMGHVDGRMVSQVYSHMRQAESHLQRVLQRRANGQAASR